MNEQMIKTFLVIVMGLIVPPPPKFTCWTLNAPVPQNVIIFEDKAFKEVIKSK